MRGGGGGVYLIVDAQQVLHGEPCALHVAHGHVNADEIVECQWPLVGHMCFENSKVNAIGSNLVIGAADMPKKLNPGFFEIGQVATVMHDAHGIGFGETHPEVMHEAIVGGVTRWLAGDAHTETVAAE